MTGASVLAALAAALGCAGAVGLAAALLTWVWRAGAASGRGRGMIMRPSGLRLRAQPARLAASALRRMARAASKTPPLRGLAPRDDLQARLAAAGPPGGLGLREWLALKSACATGGLLTAVPVWGGAPGRTGILLLLVAPAAGFLAPEAWLDRRIRRRLESAARELPDMLELLRVTIAAGMPPARALGIVGAEFRGELAQEWRRASAEIALGARQERALSDLARRLPAEEVRALIHALARSRRHGVPIAGVLAAQAARARDRRRWRVREQAARAGPKIQLAVALLLVPAVLLIVAAGIVTQLQRSELLLPL